MNSTLSIDLSKSWSNTGVVINVIPKKRPTSTKANQVLWTDPSSDTFYIFGGKWLFGENMNETEVWKFTADGKGRGDWALQEPANPSLFNGHVPSEFGVFATANGTGFQIGGLASGWTQIRRASSQAVPGMLAFNMKTKVWSNGTEGFSPVGTISGGSAHYVPSFGPRGLVMVMGGQSFAVDGEIKRETAKYFDLRNLTFFDPQTKTQYWQITTGDIPPWPRSGFCTAGFQNTDGGYEM